PPGGVGSSLVPRGAPSRSLMTFERFWLVREKSVLASFRRAISGAVLVQHAMAGHAEANALCSTGVCDRADRVRRVDPLGNARIGGGLADGDLAHFLPNAPLERRAADVEREAEGPYGGLDVAQYPRDQRLRLLLV